MSDSDEVIGRGTRWQAQWHSVEYPAAHARLMILVKRGTQRNYNNLNPYPSDTCACTPLLAREIGAAARTADLTAGPSSRRDSEHGSDPAPTGSRMRPLTGLADAGPRGDMHAHAGSPSSPQNRALPRSRPSGASEVPMDNGAAGRE